MDLVEVILSKEDKNNGLDIPPPLYISKPTNEYQSRSSSLDQNTPDISQGGQFDAAIGPSPQKTSESGAQEKTQKNHEKGSVMLILIILALTKEIFDSLNNVLAPMSLEGVYFTLLVPYDKH